jgi:hypothetical protein
MGNNISTKLVGTDRIDQDIQQQHKNLQTLQGEHALAEADYTK